ncbi:MAG: hypothetical protein ACE14S_12175 [Candidatus Bathyarchaeia archaeon]
MRAQATKITCTVLIAFGALAIVISIIYDSPVLAFTGLGLLFWGITFAYIQTNEYARKDLLDATALSAIQALNQMARDVGCEGKAVYLPPKYMKDMSVQRVFVPRMKNGFIPKPEQIQDQGENMFVQNPQGLLFLSPGAELTGLFEKSLEIDFIRVDLAYLRKRLPRLFVEELEIAKSLEIEVAEPVVHVRIENPLYRTQYNESRQQPDINATFGSCLTSAIASTLAKATGKPVTITKEEASEDGKTITSEYAMLDEGGQVPS